MPLQLSTLVRVVNHKLGWQLEIRESRYIGSAAKQSLQCLGALWDLLFTSQKFSAVSVGYRFYKQVSMEQPTPTLSSLMIVAQTL